MQKPFKWPVIFYQPTVH